MPLIVDCKHKMPAILDRQHGNRPRIDVTSKGPEPWVRFSPFYPYGNIPVPFSPGVVSASVEGVWQGLKVFEMADIDIGSFANTTMQGLKRTIRKFGQPRGHRAGVAGQRLLSYREARYEIYLPTYRWVLEMCLHEELAKLRSMSQSETVVLLDYETNGDIEDLSKPLSHAALIVRYVNGEWLALED